MRTDVYATHFKGKLAKTGPTPHYMGLCQELADHPDQWAEVPKNLFRALGRYRLAFELPLSLSMRGERFYARWGQHRRWAPNPARVLGSGPKFLAAGVEPGKEQ